MGRLTFAYVDHALVTLFEESPFTAICLCGNCRRPSRCSPRLPQTPKRKRSQIYLPPPTTTATLSPRKRSLLAKDRRRRTLATSFPTFSRVCVNQWAPLCVLLLLSSSSSASSLSSSLLSLFVVGCCGLLVAGRGWLGASVCLVVLSSSLSLFVVGCRRCRRCRFLLWIASGWLLWRL